MYRNYICFFYKICKLIPIRLTFLLLIDVFTALLQPVELNVLGKITKMLTNINLATINSLLILAGIFIFIYVCKTLSSITNSIISGVTQNRLNHLLYGELFKVLSQIDLTNYDSANFNLKLLRSKKVIESVGLNAVISLIDIVATIVGLISISIIIINVNIIYFVIFALIACLQNIYSFRIAKENVDLDRLKDKIGRKHLYLFKLLYSRDSTKEIRSYNLYDWIENKRDNEFQNIANIGLKFTKRWIKINSLWATFMYLVEGGLLVFMVQQLTISHLDLSQLIVVFQSYTMFLNSVSSLVNSVNTIYRNSALIADFQDIMNTPSNTVSTIGGMVSDKVKVSDVSFSYDKIDKTLDHINFEISPGETIAIVGHNGSGKSTLAKILLKMIEPDSGHISIPSDSFCAVFQDFAKFNLTVFENVVLGDVDTLTNGSMKILQKIEYALEKSQCNYFVRNLPSGLNTFLGNEFEENGTDISLGQWQRLAFSRIIYRDSVFIVFDEPTASLDPIAEKKQFEYIRNLLQSKTVVLISHRIGLNRLANRIVYLENGRIVESGTHSDLMNLHGSYYKFYNAQAKWYQDSAQMVE